ncbi:MAG: hypothetical protein ACJ751_06335 [Niastella sp.]|uniref:hypothetical protein n=1 Tax=Niastella sp. TaxID=1869183 RepID=UPI003899BDD0
MRTCGCKYLELKEVKNGALNALKQRHCEVMVVTMGQLFKKEDVCRPYKINHEAG